jgi:circadian clock protein KaiC
LHQNEAVRGFRPRVSSGIEGLDEVLLGGLPADRLYLIEGAPGTGKTTLALQFLLEGRDKGERGLYITLSETKAELSDVAALHGWSLGGIDLYELESTEARLTPEEEYTVFRPEDVELTKPYRKFARRWSGWSRIGWSLILSRRCSCWRAIRFDTAARSWL